MVRLSLRVAACCLIGFSGIFCSRGEAQEASPSAIEFFEKSVRPILVEHCYECHAGAESNGGLRLDYRDGLRIGGETGAAIVPGSPDASLMIQAVRYTNPDLQMPPSGPLTAAQIEILEKWITGGASDPREEIPEAKVDRPMGMSVETGRKFWSMLPLSDPAIPRVKNQAWVQNPIDAFILKKLEEAELTPAPDSSRRDLLRRLSFDLTGLPPTLEDRIRFEQDTAPGVVERCIDQLLSSPQYGVRFGRHWLDVARYADSNGLDENIAFGNAWRYRDYVVDAFNTDKPFSRFIEEQIAGDLLPDANRETTTGTGFLVLGAKVLAEPDREKLVMDSIDEQLDTIGKCFMGLTLGCVRCHDHKFDPIKQRDYYALAAIFKGTKTFGDTNFGAIKHWNEVLYATAEERERLKGVDAKIAEKQAEFNAAKNAAMQALRERVRSQGALILAAASRLSPQATLGEWSEVGRAEGLHPRVLNHCRRHLEFHREDPFFAPWHAMAARGDSDGIRTHYQAQFDAAQAAWDAAIKADPKITKLDDEVLEAARAALNDPSGFLAIPAKMEHALDDETIASLHAIATESRLIESAAPDATAVMGVADQNVIDALAIHIRGSHRNLGEAVARNFPEVLQDPNYPTIFPRRNSGRLELARWLASPNHPLTARVIVNRVWRWHFGKGLVPSTENFGQLGDRPSHPELLDYLARWFIESGWSIKELNRLILTSRVYQMQSHHDSAERALAIDPENRLLWRFRSQRLSAEQARDAILEVAGNLDLRLGGKSVPLRNRQFVFDHTSIDHTRYDSLRRTAYLPVIRNHLFTLLEQFDFPDPTMPSGDRQSTTIAPQSLLLMNADWVLDAADRLASRSGEAATLATERIDWLMNRTLGRPATEAERNAFLQFIGSELPSDANDPTPRPTRWMLLAHNLLVCNEFFYLR